MNKHTVRRNNRTVKTNAEDPNREEPQAVKLAAEEVLFPLGTMGFCLIKPMTIVDGERVIQAETERRRPIENDFACVGDTLFISLVDGRYTHCEEEGGVVIVDGKLHGILRRV